MTNIDILGVSVSSLKLLEVVKEVEKSVMNHKPLRIITANAEMIMLAQKNLVLKKSLDHADIVVPDGAGVVWAAKELEKKIIERVAGIDLADELLFESSRKKWKVFFLGAAPTVAEQAKLKIQLKYPGLEIVGTQDGYFSFEKEDEVIRKINESQAEILFVAFGVPKQEIWLDNFNEKLLPIVRMGVGGSFDVMAGQVKRAPQWMQQNSLEWLYRALGQPSRWKRLLALPKFVLAVKARKT